MKPSIFAKNGDFGLGSSIILGFLGFFRLRTEPGLSKTGSSTRFFHSKTAVFLSVFRANRPKNASNSSVGAANGPVDIDFTSPVRFWPPQAPRPPRRPPQEVLEKFVFFQFFVPCEEGLLATCSPSPLAASRPGGTARNVLSCLNRLTRCMYTFLTRGAEEFE